MDYKVKTELEVAVKVQRHTEREDFEEIVHSSISDAFECNFAEFQWEFDVGDELSFVEIEIEDENAYMKNDHYQVCRELLDSLFQVGFSPLEAEHSTELVEIEEEEEENEIKMRRKKKSPN